MIDISDPGHVSILLGTLIILGVIYYSFDKLSFIRNGIITKGIVIDRFVPKSSENYPLSIKIQFTSSEGKEIVFVEQLGLKPTNYYKSDEVEIIYDKNHPTTAYINKIIFIWSLEVILFLAGSGMVFIGVYGK